MGMNQVDLDQLAVQHGGVLTRGSLAYAGLSSGAIGRAVRAGRLIRHRHGGYTTPAFLESLGDDRWAQHALTVKCALASAGPDAVAADASAAAVHGLDMFGPPPDRPVLVMPVARHAKARPTSTAIARAARLPESHVTTVDNWAATTVARTMVDIARRRQRRRTVVAGDFALRTGLTIAQLDQALAECRRAPGIRRAREDLLLCDARSESPLESLARLALADRNVPAPELQYEIGPFRVDFCWPEDRVILEVDGRQKYQTPDDLFAEKRREDWLRAHGYIVIRATWDDVLHRPAELCSRIRRALAQAAA
jgi:very-short-patch-repair endonuclease